MGTVSTATRKRSVKPGDEPNTGAADRAGAGHPTEATGERSGPSNNGDGRVRPRFIDRRSVFIVVCLIALAGVAGTVGFGMAWSNGNAQQTGEAQAKSTAATFLTALTNFDAKSIDADFSQITSMATGDFSSQADKFFGSNIRQKLEAALATSRGQIRDIYVESYGGGQASVYSVIDQVYANNTSKTPQSDVLRVVVNLTRQASGWKVSNVTVLEGASPT